jgi:hypothetical protein
MKKIILLVAVLTLLFSAQTTKAQFAGGDGSAASPFQISDRAALEALRDYVGEAGKGKHFTLTADIDLAGANWEPIAVLRTSSAASPSALQNDTAFFGKLHGAGYKIKNMTIRQKSIWLAGLFGQIGAGALIENLHIVGGSVIQEQINYPRVASIAGRIFLAAEATEGITINNCSNTAPILDQANNSNTGNMAGGLVGEAVSQSDRYDIVISSCYNTGNVTGGMHKGGIVGITNGYVVVRDCYFAGEINSTHYNDVDEVWKYMNGASYVGGIVGLIRTEGIIENCYATGSINNVKLEGSTVTSTYYSGGITGRAEATSGVIKNSVALQTAIINSTASATAWRVRGGNATSDTQVHAPVTNCYAITDMDFKNDGVTVTKSSTDANSADGADVTPAAAKTAAFYTGLGWDFTNVWTIEEGASYPTLRTNPVGNRSPESVNSALNAFAYNGVLTVKGLVEGEKVSVYTVLGQLVSSKVATASEVTVSLPAQGIYVVAAGNRSVKVVNK